MLIGFKCLSPVRPKWFQPNQTHNPAREKLSNQRGTSNQSARGWSSRVRGGGRNGGSRGSNQPQSRINSNKEDQETNTSTNNPNLPYSGLTLENYERLLPPWTKKQLRQVLGRQKGGLNQIPLEVKEALQLHRMNYTKIKFMLALIGTVSAKPVNSWLGEDGPSREKSNWNQHVAYSKESANTPAMWLVPPEGCPYGWDEQNGHLGTAWKSLPEEAPMVFDAKVFRDFSKIPIAYDGEDDRDNKDKDGDNESKLLNGNTAKQLISQEEEEKYTPTNQIQKKRSNFCKELSNDATWLQVAHEKWTAKATFEAYSQGQTIQAIVDGCSGVGRPSKIRKVADKIRSNLRESLNQLLGMLFMSLIASHSTIDHSSFIGQAGELLRVESLNFPKGSDPEASLLGGYPCLMIV
ncbi:hypothetical protein H4Q26_013954 [Puccinia striiformis f. sp. tritici PST-130]|uniref:Uncharacterized protein n=2 Tax=Puccinia striiformis TaxID=27350 RepID=A0A0L0VJ68_9BASI|nr:hypothetical protein H4Q26_013954 [Puccinia striiformis f. sp. tritici PST-130]KNE99337.1 hypothetical protein PSTG_07454 [Puccinia striiformis f. sp. tritici PST-78]POW09841.1 hypothetical protein PSTT_06526 [Puccinia striiformis]